MSKTSILLILMLIFAAGIYFFITNTPDKTLIPVLMQPVEKPQRAAQATLTLYSEKTIPGQNIIIAVDLNTTEITPYTIQLEIGYDPLLLTAMSIIPGKYFQNPEILIRNINPRNGRISYALSCVPIISQKSCISPNDHTVAYITFAANASVLNKKTEIKLLPKTLIKSKEDRKLILKTSGIKLGVPVNIIPISTSSANLQPY